MSSFGFTCPANLILLDFVMEKHLVNRKQFLRASLYSSLEQICPSVQVQVFLQYPVIKHLEPFKD